ncbi:hypothetical protein ACLUX0_03330 [Limosilactobacillus mucosae]
MLNSELGLSDQVLDWRLLDQLFNMVQDFIGSRVLFDSGVALVQLPCLGVILPSAVQNLRIT